MRRNRRESHCPAFCSLPRVSINSNLYRPVCRDCGDPIAGNFLIGEVLERYLFFSAVIAPKMQEPLHEHRRRNKRSVLADLLWQPTGPLTRDLLSARPLWIGKVPAGKQPRCHHTMVCGFCSTGCGLNIHLQDGGRSI